MPVEMTLTGSRFFGTERPDSDWDYFAQDSPEARGELEHAGFICTAEALSPTSNCRAVYQSERMHVMLMRNAAQAVAVQELMFRRNFGPLLRNKAFAHALWQFAYDLLDRRIPNGGHRQESEVSRLVYVARCGHA